MQTSITKFLSKHWVDIVFAIVFVTLIPFAYWQLKATESRQPIVTDNYPTFTIVKDAREPINPENKLADILRALTADNGTILHDVIITISMDNTGNESFTISLKLYKGEQADLD